VNPILARFQDEPALLEPGSQAWFESCVSHAADTLAEIEKRPEVAHSNFWPEAGSWMSLYRPYNVSKGVLMVPVKGVLLKDFPYADGGYATGYEYIAEAMKRGMDDDDVKGIALLIDSPGGMVSGNFDLVDKMYGMRGQKPVQAFAADSAYSAAYSIASSADKITVSRSGGVGSIGVVTTHVDYSKMMEERGIKVTFIFAGKHKVDGNPYEPLPEAVRGKIQERIDALYGEFVSIVARNRDMDEKAVRKTEADTFMAADAIELGLADEAGSFEDAFTAFAASLNFTEEDTEMANENKAGITEDALALAVATATAEGRAAGQKEAMDRINAIIGSDAAKTRTTAALNAALKTNMPAEEAVQFLATLPEEKPVAAQPTQPQGAGAPAGMLAAAMAGTEQPQLGAGAEGSQKSEKTTAQETVELAKAYGLSGFVENKE
jgi:signal peptide peptidase SppA